MRRRLGWVAMTGVGLAFAWYIWPTPYRYVDTDASWVTAGVVQFREHRATGAMQVYVLGYGWRSLRERETLQQRIQRLRSEPTPP